MINETLHCPGCTGQAVSEKEIAALACRQCGRALEARIDGRLPFGSLVARDRGLPWRYPSLLPVGYVPELDDRCTPPTVRSSALEERLEIDEAWLVDCTTMGTGTFKDLEATIVIAGAAAMGLASISVHSTGNTAVAYRHYARRLGLPCASYVPLWNADKLGDVEPDDHFPVYLVDTDFPNVSAVAKRHAAAAGRQHLAPLNWKLAGKASLAWWLYEHMPQVNLIVQTVAGGYGPLGYEWGFERLGARVDASRAVLTPRHYLLFQPADADGLTRAWGAGSYDLAIADLRLPQDPFEPTLQSTNPVATLPMLRKSLPKGSRFQAVAPTSVEDLRLWSDKVLSEAGIELDYERERSAYISLAGLAQQQLVRSTKLALIVTGSRPFRSRAAGDVGELLRV
jgi:hypothetical protein